ncbi:hypothetical protein [Streptomyces sp. NPDC051546]|uniref:hypothetical protein n=1 Tax=Streptomyces sp. NPDC051546 TaxID=3365655 RepID=UPI0037906BC6
MTGRTVPLIHIADVLERALCAVSRLDGGPALIVPVVLAPLEISVQNAASTCRWYFGCPGDHNFGRTARSAAC